MAEDFTRDDQERDTKLRPEQSESEGESIQDAMNMVRACLFGNSSTLSGAIKDEPTRLLIADKINRLDSAVDAQIEELKRERDEAKAELALRDEADETRWVPFAGKAPENWIIWICEMCGGSTVESDQIEPHCTCEPGEQAAGHGIALVDAARLEAASRLISSTVKWCEEEADRAEELLAFMARDLLRSCAAKLKGEGAEQPERESGRLYCSVCGEYREPSEADYVCRKGGKSEPKVSPTQQQIEGDGRCNREAGACEQTEAALQDAYEFIKQSGLWEPFYRQAFIDPPPIENVASLISSTVKWCEEKARTFSGDDKAGETAYLACAAKLTEKA